MEYLSEQTKDEGRPADTRLAPEHTRAYNARRGPPSYPVTCILV
jgi:hypothetical protein